MSLASCIPHLDSFEEDACRLVGILRLDKQRLGSILEICSSSMHWIMVLSAWTLADVV